MCPLLSGPEQGWQQRVGPQVKGFTQCKLERARMAHLLLFAGVSATIGPTSGSEVYLFGSPSPLLPIGLQGHLFKPSFFLQYTVTDLSCGLNLKLEMSRSHQFASSCRFVYWPNRGLVLQSLSSPGRCPFRDSGLYSMSYLFQVLLLDDQTLQKRRGLEFPNTCWDGVQASMNY